MTCKEMFPAIGQTVQVRFESVRVYCIVLDCKMAWGRTRIEIEPHSGKGSQWVELERVEAMGYDEQTQAIASRR